MTTKIKIITLLAAFLLTGLFSYGQKCKYNVEKKDAFTGEMTHGIRVILNLNYYLTFNKTGSDYKLIINGTAPTTETLRQRDSLLLKINATNGALYKDNSANATLILYPDKDVEPTALAAVTAGSAMYYGSYLITYSITEEQLQMLGSGNLAVIRLNIGTKTYDKEISAKLAAKIKKAIDCILQ